MPTPFPLAFQLTRPPAPGEPLAGALVRFDGLDAREAWLAVRPRARRGVPRTRAPVRCDQKGRLYVVLDGSPVPLDFWRVSDAITPEEHSRGGSCSPAAAAANNTITARLTDRDEARLSRVHPERGEAIRRLLDAWERGGVG